MFITCIGKKINRILSRMSFFRKKIKKEECELFTNYYQSDRLSVRVYRSHTEKQRNDIIKKMYEEGNTNKSSLQSMFGISYYTLSKIIKVKKRKYNKKIYNSL